MSRTLHSLHSSLGLATAMCMMELGRLEYAMSDHVYQTTPSPPNPSLTECPGCGKKQMFKNIHRNYMGDTILSKPYPVRKCNGCGHVIHPQEMLDEYNARRDVDASS